MGQACGIHEGEEKCIHFFNLENLKEQECLEDMAIDQRLTSTLILENIM
jgi:hypothetical protein